MNKHDILSSRELNMRCLHTGNDMNLILTELEELEGKDFDVSRETFEKILTLPYNKFGKRAMCVAPFYSVGIFDDGEIRRIVDAICYNDGTPACVSMEDYLKLVEIILSGYPSLQRELLTACEEKQWDGFEDEPEARHLLDVAAAKGITPVECQSYRLPIKFDVALTYIYPTGGAHTRNAVIKAASYILQPTSAEDLATKMIKLLRGEFK